MVTFAIDNLIRGLGSSALCCPLDSSPLGNRGQRCILVNIPTHDSAQRVDDRGRTTARTAGFSESEGQNLTGNGAEIR